nr:hypothetical protein [Chitinasiproducens palmae]
MPHCRSFASDAMRAALARTGALRARQRAGEPSGFVAPCSAHPASIGRPGGGDPPADHEWKKRRV